ncbi:hypothetical protein K440DRAFT_626203 [Wilcoxina mikolae CBS 423.85]|nr:hypothetical protein K440DRAFT_626203 [Wilcoxina mikolae CBS 423.85]
MSEASTDTGEHKQEIVRLETCPYGNMQIVLKTAEVYATYLVSSHQLCSASPVFRAMLGPKSSFAEAVELRRHEASTSLDATEDLYEVVVEDHDPTALSVVLYIIHGRPQFLPDEISFENLMEVAIVVDYYDCAEIMRPWSEMWMAQWRDYAETLGYENWLFIAWVFGVQEVFGALTKTFSRNCVKRNGEFMVNRAGPDAETKIWKVLDCHIPQSIIDGMWTQRSVIVKEIFWSYRSTYGVYDKDMGVCFVKSGDQRKEPRTRPCFHLRFSALHKGFIAAGIPMKEEADFDAPESLLDDIMLGVKGVVDGLVADVKITKIDGINHAYCTLSEKNMVSEIEYRIENIKQLQLRDFSRRHMTLRKDWEGLLESGMSVGNVVNPESK